MWNRAMAVGHLDADCFYRTGVAARAREGRPAPPPSDALPPTSLARRFRGDRRGSVIAPPRGGRTSRAWPTPTGPERAFAPAGPGVGW